MTGLDGVTAGRSSISAPSSRAVHLHPDLALGPEEAFVIDTEFAHLHGPHDGSLHLALPRDVVDLAADRGWAELHPIARAGIRPPTLAMLYSPRDQEELEVIWTLVEASHRFARGRPGNPGDPRLP